MHINDVVKQRVKVLGFGIICEPFYVSARCF